ncbi:DsbA family protein [Corynebacterium lubricantis]|uniref:DsbA family protein n=1 Tax=Corynebacterium lubricantis TaxID=541095 RepID=UPI00038018EF|nr:DsbA family protein [Corynebacterium lubricantis]
MNDRIQLTYAFDAYCGWCYGFGPSLRKFAADNADRVDIKVLSGGLFAGPRAGAIGAYPHIPGANARIAALTGVEFGESYNEVLEKGEFVMDSTDPAIGLVALRRQVPERAVEIAGAIQRAWYFAGADLGDVEVYRSIATEFGLDADQVAADFAKPETQEEALEDFRQLREMGVDSYPTLLLHTESGTHRLGGPTTKPEALTAALDQHLSAKNAVQN